jgi:hypothetical protein
LNMRELEAQAKFLAPVISAAVAKAVQPLQDLLSQKAQQIEALQKRIDDIPEPVGIDLEAIAALVVVPEPIAGKDADPVDLDALAKAAADLVVVPMPQAPEIDLQAVAKAAAEFVQLPKIDLTLLAAEAAALVDVPEPIPGKNADPVDLDALARSAAALVPVPAAAPAEHGRDALELEVLPTIDEAKQYARGTYAAFRGGLWRSYERTHGMRGWECLVDGVDGVTVTQDSVREFSVTLSKSSGAAVVEKFTMPATVYKGVWRPGDAEQGDLYTFGGSLWHCNEATEDKPGDSKAWTLAAKRGKDGNNAVPIDRPAPGVVQL